MGQLPNHTWPVLLSWAFEKMSRNLICLSYLNRMTKGIDWYSLFLYVYIYNNNIYTYTYAHISTHIYAYLFICVCWYSSHEPMKARSQHLVPSITSTLLWGKVFLFESGAHWIWCGLPTNPESLPSAPSAGIADMNTPPSSLSWCWRSELKSPCLHQKSLTQVLAGISIVIM